MQSLNIQRLIPWSLDEDGYETRTAFLSGTQGMPRVLDAMYDSTRIKDKFGALRKSGARRSERFGVKVA
jgi:hypothetical protein